MSKQPRTPLGIKDDVFEELDDEQRATLRYIEDFDLSSELRAAVEEGDIEEDEVEAAERETKRFLALAFLQEVEDRHLGPTRKVDAVWHAFILNTEAYHAFSMRVYQEILHHVPATAEVRDAPLENARSVVEELFESVDKTIWEGPADICFCQTRRRKSGRKRGRKEG